MRPVTDTSRSSARPDRLLRWRTRACWAVLMALAPGVGAWAAPPGRFDIDRFEPPMAVLIGPDGLSLTVPLSSLPPEARPGDRMSGPTGPIVGDRVARSAGLRARLARLAGPPRVGDAIDLDRPAPVEPKPE